MVRTKKLLALAAAGALVLAACGSDDATSDATTPAGTDAPDGTDAPASTDAPDTTDGADTTDAPDTTDAGELSGAEFVVDTEACDDPDAATAQIETLKIGTSIPLSGGPAVLFAPVGAGQQAYIDYYNAEFGGIDGTPIELTIKDDQYTADLTKANVDKLIFDDEVTLLSGIIGTPNILAIRDDVNAQCIPTMWGETGASEWGDIDNYPWITGLLVPYEIESRVFADFIEAELPEGSTAAVFYVNTEFGQEYLNAFQELADEKGIEIVAVENIDPADSGAPSAQMTNLVQANPDAILAVPLGAQCISFMTELGNAKAANPDFDPAVYQTATCASPLFFNAVSNGGSDGVYTSANVKFVDDPKWADDPDVKVYVDAMAASAPDINPADLTAVAGWASMELAVYVAEQALASGDYSRAGIINAARNIDHVGGLGLPGLKGQMNADDGYYAEGTQLLAWSDGSKSFVAAGEVTDYNGTLGIFTP